MALIKADRVKETSTSTGTGTFTLAGAATGYRTFSSVCAIGDTFYYAISNQSNGEWESGLGTYSAANTLTRTTVHASSNSGNAVTFSAGTKEVFLTLTARHLDRIQDNGQSTAIGSKTSVVAVNDSATLPDLDLQFADLKTLTAKYGPTPSYSRASTGTYFNASGVLTSAAVNEPRFDHVFENGAWVSKGLLIEEQRTNICTHSTIINVFFAGGQFSTVQLASELSPSGGQSYSIKEDTSTNPHRFFNPSVTLTNGVYYTLSFYAKSSDRWVAPKFQHFEAGCVFDLQNGTIAQTVNAGGLTQSSIQNVGNGWYRCSISVLGTGTTAYMMIAMNNKTAANGNVDTVYAGNGTSYINIWGLQFETGNFPSSLIQTSGSSLTRSADVCQITGSAFTNLWNATEGSIVLEQDLLSYSDPAADQRYFAVAGGYNSPGLTLHYDGGSSFYWERYFNSASSLTLSDISAAYKVAIAFKTNDYATTLNGATPVTATSPAFGTNFAKMDIGYQVGSAARSSWIQRLRYFRSRLDNTQLVNLSGGINTLAFKPVTGSGSVTVANEYTGINISVPNPLPITNGGTGAQTQLNAVTNLVGNPPNDGGQYTLASKKTSGTPTFYWVDGTGYAPTLDLLFAADKSLTAYKGPTPSFSRASTGTFFNSSGVLTSAAINDPRFNHTFNGTSWVSRGLLVEEQRTNSFYYSESASNLGMINASVTSNAYTAPDGTQTADAIIPDTGSYNHGAYLYENGDGTNWAVSCFAKASGYRYFSINVGSAAALFDLTDGVYTGTSGGSPLSYGITNAGNGWYRIWVASATTNGSPSEIRFQISNSSSAIGPSFSGNNVDGVQIWGMQREKSASFPTSYIKNTGSGSTTRSADVCQITGSDFSGFWNGTEGAVVVEYDRLAPIGSATPGYNYPRTFAFTGSSGNQIELYGNQTSPPKEEVVSYLSGGLQFVFSPETINNTAGGVQKVALSIKLNDSALSYGGASVLTDTSCSIPTVTTLSLGSFGGSANYLNGHIARLRYYPVRLPNATLQVLST